MAAAQIRGREEEAIGPHGLLGDMESLKMEKRLGKVSAESKHKGQ